ncbi:MAG: 2-C-methyl-D-erythritol 4-phosphate cytidylyltransferase [Planctomycetota bacterium]|nr:MAG: 2-C-methyl-D-erythritol 4-phosphate cytidylyltransferase [Planctomycetota bacterium]
MGCGVVIAAAGAGSRLGGTPKQIRPLCGRPVCAWSWNAFNGLVDAGVVVTSAPLLRCMEDLLAVDPPQFPCQVVAGGDSRLQSVWNGIQALPEECDTVLIHDAARPLVSSNEITACRQALSEHIAAVVAIPCSATVKRCQSDSTTIAATVSRNDLWLAQTPQGMRRSAAHEAFPRLLEHDAETLASITDDVSVMEWAGIPSVVVPGQASNLKITSNDDWQIAEAIMAWRHDDQHS